MFLFLFRLERKAAPSATNSCSGLTGSSWSTTSATTAASPRSFSSCRWSAAAERHRLSPSSSWGTSGTCRTTAGSLARRAVCSLWPSAAASSRCRRLRRTTASCWCFTSWSTLSGRPGLWGRAWPGSEGSSGLCLQCLGGNEPNRVDARSCFNDSD